MQNLCYICSTISDSLKKIDNVDEDGIEFIKKFQKFIPEIEWTVDYLICPQCIEQLNNVYNFRELCINSYILHQQKIEEENQIQQNKEELPVAEVAIDNFVCYHCNEKFQLKTYLIEHISTKHRSIIEETNENSFSTNICEICGATFNNKYLLKRHIKTVHATEKKFKCDQCERKFVSLIYLNAHKRYHSGERNHICSFCGKGYKTASDLYHHEKIHANKRAYRCELCPKAFNTSSYLHKHKICVHSDKSTWKYECALCQRRFPLKTNLDSHIKTHTGERNLGCNICGHKSINKSVLKRHMLTHSDLKSFKCQHCCQRYKYKKSLELHLTKIHGMCKNIEKIVIQNQAK